MVLFALILASLLAAVVVWLVHDGLPWGPSELPPTDAPLPASDDVRLLKGVLSTAELAFKYYSAAPTVVIEAGLRPAAPTVTPAVAPGAADLHASAPRPCRMEPSLQWPAAVLMRDVLAGIEPRKANGFVCMGALLSRRVVLTSAVCFKLYAEPDAADRSFPRGLRVRAYAPQGAALPRGHRPSMACASRDVDAVGAGRHYCDVAVQAVAVSSERGAALLLLAEALPEAAGGAEHACPPAPGQDTLLDYSECLLSGYGYSGQWNANLTRRFNAPAECPLVRPLVCAHGLEGLGEVSAGSPLLCRGPGPGESAGAWRLAAVSLGPRWPGAADSVELYVSTTTIAPWIAEVLDIWSQATPFNSNRPQHSFG